MLLASGKDLESLRLGWHSELFLKPDDLGQGDTLNYLLICSFVCLMSNECTLHQALCSVLSNEQETKFLFSWADRQ